jgi:7,8-dihydroneopterin aldolase/epimerase/oxygenase
VIVEVHGLEAKGRHGADDHERAEPQRFLFDVELELAEPNEDALSATADYRGVRDAVREICERESYLLIETLAGAVADALLTALPVEGVRVRVRKPGITWAEWTAATVERP